MDPARQGQGIGRALLEEFVATARQQKFYSLLARMAEGSAASAHLHLQLGFQLVGCLKKIGYKFDRRLDVEIYQKLLQ